MITALWIIGGMVAALVSVAALYMHWQATIKPLPAAVLFEVVTQPGDPAPQNQNRLLPLQGTHNCRDLGGYTTSDGQHVAWGRVYRSDVLDRLTAHDHTLLRERGVRLAVDLRAHSEVARQPDRLPGGMAYRHLPVFARDPLGRRQIMMQRHRLDSMFRQMYHTHIITRGAPVIGAVLKLVADPANLPLLFHCTGGKDRTGVIAALLLHICGVPRATIVADYTLTNRAVPALIDSLQAPFETLPAWLGLRLEQFYPLLSARPAIIEDALEFITMHHGSIDAYLHGPVGLADTDIAAIRDNLRQ